MSEPPEPASLTKSSDETSTSAEPASTEMSAGTSAPAEPASTEVFNETSAGAAAPRTQVLDPARRRRGGFRMFAPLIAEELREVPRLIANRLSFRKERNFGATWARRGTRSSEPDLVSHYHRTRSEAQAERSIDDRTWSDLDGDRLFRDINACVCPLGEQVLYAMLRSPEVEIAPLLERDAAADRLTEAPALRHRLQKELSKLDTGDAYYLPNLFGALPPRPRFWFIFPALTVLAGILIILLPFAPLEAIIGLLVVVATNITIQVRYHTRILPYVRPLTLVNRLLSAARAIGGLSDPVLGRTFDELATHATRVKALSRAARYVSVERRWDDIIGAAYAYANMLFLLDVNAFVFSVASIARHRRDIESIFERLGFLDAAISIASWRASLDAFCRPSLVPPGRSIEVRGIVHPLLEDAVGNDLDVDGRSVLITGSNMAGKTTFIRALAVNAILAQSLYTCTAESFRCPWLRVRTMISRSDDLARGQSYFGVELELALSLVRAAGVDAQHLFVIDEIFRGTNTVERVAAAKAVLQALAGNGHIVVAATHDLELLPLLAEGWEFHHFRESIVDGRLTFDYRIHVGPTSTHNALRMMEAYGFPEAVVIDARDTVSRIDRRWRDDASE